MKIIYFISKKILFWSLRYVYSYIDKNKDGKIDITELKLIQIDLKKLIKNYGK